MPTCFPTLVTAKGKVYSRPASSHADKDEGLPASRISDILGASSLSDEDIQQLIQELFDKMNANAEWQAAVSVGMGRLLRSRVSWCWQLWNWVWNVV